MAPNNKIKKFLVFFSFFSVYAFAQSENNSSHEPIQPLPTTTQISEPQKVKLGSMLFQEKRLSKNHTVSCANCHNLQRGGVDGLAKSVGINGATGDINAPTVFNSGFNFRQFWNGRAKTLEDQIDGPVQHPKEMGNTWEEVENTLKAEGSYPELFNQVYPDGITRQNIKNAIASFERTLVTPNSRFDRYLRGEKTALSTYELTGYQKFKSFGCIACHQGMNVGGNMFQTMGVMGDYFKDRGTPITESDLGRYTITKQESDRYVFRVPSLRNVELSAPYFHDGSGKNLEQAVDVMAKYQLGRNLSQKEVGEIVAFLKTLTGETPGVLRQPAQSLEQFSSPKRAGGH